MPGQRSIWIRIDLAFRIRIRNEVKCWIRIGTSTDDTNHSLCVCVCVCDAHCAGPHLYVWARCCAQLERRRPARTAAKNKNAARHQHSAFKSWKLAQIKDGTWIVPELHYWLCSWGKMRAYLWPLVALYTTQPPQLIKCSHFYRQVCRSGTSAGAAVFRAF